MGKKPNVTATRTAPLLQLHLEPDEPIEIGELTASLGALARQYEAFAAEQGIGGKGSEPKLLVASVSPGSIDINFVPELAVAGALVYPLIDQVELLTKFAGQIKKLFEFFKRGPKPLANVTVKECDDAVNIAAPIANHGGNQTVNIINADVFMPVLVMSAADAKEVVEQATAQRALLQHSRAERRERVAMVWSRLDKEKTKTSGTASPDKGRIEEIDDAARPVLFTDELAYLKREMMKDEENPYQMVYFVDVEVSRTNSRVTHYRVVGFHGKEPLE